MKTPHFVLAMTAALALAACSRPEAPQEPIRSVKLITVAATGLGAQHARADHGVVLRDIGAHHQNQLGLVDIVIGRHFGA